MSIIGRANEICLFRSETLHEQFPLHLHLLYRLKEIETNAIGPVPTVTAELVSPHANRATGKRIRAISANDSRGGGKQCVIFGCQLSGAPLGGSCHIGHRSFIRGHGKPSACVRYAGRRSRTMERGGLPLICHLGRQHLLLSREARKPIVSFF